jgi:hypothetical protein
MRNINQTETQVLFKNKLDEGKDEREAFEEIKRDREFIRNLNINNRNMSNLNKIIERKDKEIYKLKLEIKKIKSKKVNQEFVNRLKKVSSGETGYYANTLDLFRIIKYLEEFGECNLSKIQSNMQMCPNKCKNAFNFLVKMNLIKQSTGIASNGRQTIYFERC